MKNSTFSFRLHFSSCKTKKTSTSEGNLCFPYNVTMAQLNVFNAALIRCGFNADMANAITNEGFDTLETLAYVEEDDIDAMIKNIRETRCTFRTQAQGNVTFPFLAIHRFKAMHLWVTKCELSFDPKVATLIGKEIGQSNGDILLTIC